jgi:hypothetical protein
MKSLNGRNDEMLLTTPQAAEYLPYTRGTLNTFRRQMRGPKCIKIGGRYFYKVKHVREYLEGQFIDTDPRV